MFVCVGSETLNESAVGSFNLAIGLRVVTRCEIVFDIEYITEARTREFMKDFPLSEKDILGSQSV